MNGFWGSEGVKKGANISETVSAENCYLYRKKRLFFMMFIMYCGIGRTKQPLLLRYLVADFLMGGLRSEELRNFFFFLHAHILSSFLTRRGHRCHPFLPPGSCLQFFIAHRFQQSHCSSIFHRALLTHSRSRAFRKSLCAQEKVPAYLYEYALGGI